jgi:hypothetical protein
MNPRWSEDHVRLVDQDHVQLAADRIHLQVMIAHLHGIIILDLVVRVPTPLIAVDICRVQEADHHTTIDLEVHHAGVVVLGRDHEARVPRSENVEYMSGICRTRHGAAIFGI